MTIQERADLAADYKRSGKCNCCQAVTKVLADTVSTDEEDLMQLTSAFAAGMGCMEATCGALIGACMVAGLKSQGKGSPRLAKEILTNFKEKSGATICKDLKGIGSGKVLCECNDCVKNAVYAYGQVMNLD